MRRAPAARWSGGRRGSGTRIRALRPPVLSFWSAWRGVSVMFVQTTHGGDDGAFEIEQGQFGLARLLVSATDVGRGKGHEAMAPAHPG